MTVLEWTGNASASNAAGQVSVKKFYRVNGIEGEQAALLALRAGTPAEITVDSETLVRNQSSVRSNGQLSDYWDGEVTYTNTPDDNQGGSQNPLLQPTRYGLDAQTETVPYFTARDENGDEVQVTNSAGVPFEELPEKLTPTGLVTVSFNQQSKPYNWVRSVGKINAQSFSIDGDTYEPRTMMLTRAPSQNEFFGETEYFSVQLEFAYREETWVDVFDDRGTHELRPFNTPGAPLGNFLIPIRAGGQIVTRPWPLNGDGTKKPNVDDPPARLTFRPYQEVVFPNI